VESPAGITHPGEVGAAAVWQSSTGKVGRSVSFADGGGGREQEATMGTARGCGVSDETKLQVGLALLGLVLTLLTWVPLSGLWFLDR
jgi:hypothetical protein